MQRAGKNFTNRTKTMSWISILSFCFMVFLWGCRIDVNASSVVSFAKTQVKAGEAIEVTVTDSWDEESYVWMLNDTIIENTGMSYIPTEKEYNSWIKVMVYDASGNLIGSDALYFSKLPVLYINTEDGEGITDKSTYKDADMYIQGNDIYSSQYDGKIEIKGRGNTSWEAYTQKPYKIKLKKSTNLFGFGKNKHWVLLSNYLDQSMMRNMTASQLSQKYGLTTMEMTWVDVCMNGTYIGCYELCEQIRIDSSRVDISNWEDEAEEIAEKIYDKHSDALTEDDQDALEEQLCADMNWITTGTVSYKSVEYNISEYYKVSDDISGGYLFELSDEYDEVSKFTTQNGLKVMMKSPEYLVTNERMMEYAKGYWQDFEDAICSVEGYNSKGQHYSELAEFDSMVKYWLVMEIMGNNDAAFKSRYAYKDCGEKLIFGPAWDFDWGCGSATVLEGGAIGWKCSYGTLWRDFIDDPYFCVKASEEYWKIRDYLDELIQEDGIIESSYDYVKSAGNATAEKYPDPVCGIYTRIGFEADAQAFKEYMRLRIQWLDQQFASVDGIVSSLYSVESTKPYTKAAEQLAITLTDTKEDSISQKLITDGIVYENTDLNMEIATNDSETVAVKVYVNGKSFTSLAMEEGIQNRLVCNIGKDVLSAEPGFINMISVVGQNAQGDTTYTNYATVLVSGVAPEEPDVPTYAVTFECNGGTAVASATYPVEANVEKPQDPVREHYTFKGWYCDKELSQKYDFNEKITSDLTLYAAWEPKVYEVKWLDHDGTIIKTEMVKAGSNGVEPEKPNRAGYTFAGWSTSWQNIKENLVIKASYEPISIIISGTYYKPVKNKAAQKVTKSGVTSITLYTKKYKTAQLDVAVTDGIQSVNWKSSKSSVATVSKDGKVTARKAGTTYITAEVAGTSIQCKVIVKKAEITVKMNKKTVGNKTLNLKKGKKYTLKTTVVPQGKITYKVKNKKILKISSKGKITTLKKGTTTITISANGMKKKVKVKVK